MIKEFEKYKALLERIDSKEEKRKDHCQAIHEFYDDNIIQIENCEKPITGKKKLNEIENRNLDGVKAVQTKFNDVILDKDTGTAWGLMTIHFDSKINGKKKLVEAFNQKWVNGKISYQRFFYGPMVNEEE